MSIAKKTVTVLVLSCLSVACSHIYGNKGVVKDQHDEYRTATVTAPIQVPQGMDSASFGDDYPVPNSEHAQGSAVDLVPPGSLVDQVNKGQVSKAALKQDVPDPEATTKATDTKIDRSKLKSLTYGGDLQNNGQTLVLKQTPEQAWTQVGNALSKMNYRLLLQNKDINTYYILDTRLTKNITTRDTPLYQVHVVPGVDTVTVYVTDNHSQPISIDISQRVLSELNDAMNGKQSGSWYKDLWHKVF